jgi:hypothetical protein
MTSQRTRSEKLVNATAYLFIGLGTIATAYGIYEVVDAEVKIRSVPEDEAVPTATSNEAQQEKDDARSHAAAVIIVLVAGGALRGRSAFHEEGRPEEDDAGIQTYQVDAPEPRHAYQYNEEAELAAIWSLEMPDSTES